MPEQLKVSGAAPAGATDEQSAARAVQRMFDDIAPRYDFLNHALSVNVDRLWWRRTARAFKQTLERDEAGVLDLCAGTGDMAVALRSLGKFQNDKIQPLEADALHLPLPANSMDLVVSAFGFRNLSNYDAGLLEIYRVLKPRGEIGILDFNQPGGLFGKLYGFYFRNVLPRIGTLISGVKGPYEYLPASVSKFPAPEQMLKKMEAAGFREANWTPYTFGIAGLFRGIKQG